MSTYNQDYINDFEEKEYLEVLNNSNTMIRIVNNYVNRYNENTTINGRDVTLKESLDHYILKRIESNRSFLYSNEMKNYLKLFATIYNKDSSEMNTNVVFKNESIREKIIEIYFKNKRDAIIKKWNDNSKKTKDIMKKIKNNETISQDELNYISSFITRLRTSNTNDLMKYIFGKMRRTNLKFSYQVQDLVLSFIRYFYGEEELKGVRYTICDKFGDTEIKSPGVSSSNKNIIRMGKSYFNNINLHSIEDSKVERKRTGSDITFFMIVAFHEITHQLQRKRIRNEQFDNHGMGYIMSVVLNRELKDYVCNHDTNEIEMDANEFGWRKCKDFYEKYFEGVEKEQLISNCKTNISTSRMRRAFAFKKDSNDRFIPTARYDVENMRQIIIKNPKYLETFPMLKKFFTERGVRTSFLGDGEISNSFTGMDFIEYFFENNGIPILINIIKEDRITERKAQGIIKNLMYYMKEQLVNISNLKYLVENESCGEYKNKEEFTENFSNRIRASLLKKSMQFFKDSLPLIEIIASKYPSTVDTIKQYMEYVRRSIVSRSNELQDMLDDTTKRRANVISNINLKI